MYHVFFFFFNDTATTEIYTLSLHDALPISPGVAETRLAVELRPAKSSDVKIVGQIERQCFSDPWTDGADRKSTRLNSSHANISYAVFCLKKKKKPAPTEAPRHLHDTPDQPI